MRTLTTVICLLVCPLVAAFPQSTRQSRSEQIAAEFTKHKEVVRTKRGVTREKYKDVRAEPAVRQSVSDYSGRYESDWGWWIDIQVGADGRIQAAGSEGGETRTFELKDATIAWALLTGNKVYRNGRIERFEGVFMNRTERVSPTDTGITRFGLGVVLVRAVEIDGNTFDKLFYPVVR
jgi:hypothetical protein